MDIDALRSFLAFVETGSFTRAAKQISRTQSAFSAQMRKLEEEIGADLFEKDGRNLVLSEAGLNLRGHAKQLVDTHDKALINLRSYQGKKPLRLGCPEDYNETLLPTVIEMLKRFEPACSIQVYSQPSTTLRTMLDEGQLDAAILTRSPSSEEGHWLTSDQGVWIAAQDYKLSFNQPLPLALFQADCKYHAAATDGLAKKGIEFQLLTCSNTASSLRAIVKRGLAVGAMGRLSINEDVQILENMPPLPAVDIVISLAVDRHPLLSGTFLNELQGKIASQALISRER